MSSEKREDGGKRSKAGGSQRRWPRRDTNGSTPALRLLATNALITRPNDVCQVNNPEDGQSVNPDKAGCRK
ncbi:hypothetical protein T05_13181 [Trichinella murrelli]|uniref:Uncharacterized protein n=1 Tax=Trichinella murrelli TaxID=144512 RepID=A0A0V0TEN4_9BILA|nr:hypothetical protein T05_13181 [Trichinella murrelli]